jgi:uncharacterized membrane protein (DUF373 family)
MKFYDNAETLIATALLILMGLVVISGTIELAWELISSLLEPPGLFLGLAELFDVFGLFLMVLIGLELMASIRMYLDDHRIHAEMMFLVAITAITRKIVILDASRIEPLILFGIGFLIIALSAGYYLVKRNRSKPQGDS